MTDARANETQEPRPESVRQHSSLLRVASGLSLASLVQILTALLTGPIQAHVLGPAGRGELAEVQALLYLSPIVLGFGLQSFVTWSAARGGSVGTLLATGVLLNVLLTVPVLVFAHPIAQALAPHRPVLQQYLAIGLLITPGTLIGNIFCGIGIALNLWKSQYAVRVLSALVPAVGIIGLFIFGDLTVPNAAIVSMTGSASMTVALIAVTLAGTGRLRWSFPVAKEGLTYGSKVWLLGLFGAGNGYLDQLLILPLAGARQLGLYTIAATLSTIFLSVVVGPLQTALLPQVARDGHSGIHAITRTVVLAAILQGLILIVAGPLAIVVLFGDRFIAASPMLWILLGGTVFAAPNIVLGTACAGAGRPGVAAKAEAAALVVTVIGLFALVPELGGNGAATVSLVAYATTDAYLVWQARKLFGGSFSEFLIPRRTDLKLVIETAMSVSARVRHRRRKRG